jgi:hypothetical protein
VGPRRVVTASRPDGSSYRALDDEPPVAVVFEHGAGFGFVDLWQTGAPLSAAEQGGDAEAVVLEPLGGGVAWKHTILASDAARASVDGAALGAEMARRAPAMRTTGHHHPDHPGLHRTDTIDFGRILAGEVLLGRPGCEPVHLRAGDCVVQRGTWHTWTNVGDGPMRMSSVMISVPVRDDGGRP